MKKSLGLLSQKCIIEKGEIFKPHASLSFWLAQIQPLHPMNFAIIPTLSPKEPANQAFDLITK